MLLRLIFALILALAPQLAAAQIDEGRQSGDWTEGCVDRSQGKDPEKKRCFIFQRLYLEGAKEPAATIAVGRPEADRPLVAALTVPLGVHLPAGLTVWVEGDKEATRRVALLFCLRNGCEADMRMDRVMLAAFKKHLSGVLSFRMVNGHQVGLPISLKGFTRALGFIE